MGFCEIKIKFLLGFEEDIVNLIQEKCDATALTSQSLPGNCWFCIHTQNTEIDDHPASKSVTCDYKKQIPTKIYSQLNSS